MNRIKGLSSRKNLFIAYVTVGDGGCEFTVDACKALIEAGVDVIELGVPFSDPVADGPVIQRAASRALAAGAGIHDALVVAKHLRKSSNIPFLLFTYFNPLFTAGDTIYPCMKEAGIDGALVVDLPPEEAHDHCVKMRQQELSCVFVATPSTPDERIRQLSSQSEGFLYFACRKGVTGVRVDLPDDFSFHASRLSKNSNLPFVAGFGIANKHHAKEVLEAGANGFVVGSAFVQIMERYGGDREQCMKQLAHVVHQIDPRESKQPFNIERAMI